MTRRVHPGAAPRAYQCPDCDYTHIGNTAPWRKKGDTAR